MNNQTPNDSVKLALASLLTRYVNLCKAERNSLPAVQFDSPWPSPCDVPDAQPASEASNAVQHWLPQERNVENIFSSLEEALEITFHPDIKQFYGSFWSNGICAEREDINFSLIQIWNKEDEEQLKENLLGHVFSRKKAKLPTTFFIGCSHSDNNICLDNDSGEVVLERMGKKAHKVLSPSLETFLISIQPTLDDYN